MKRRKHRADKVKQAEIDALTWGFSEQCSQRFMRERDKHAPCKGSAESCLCPCHDQRSMEAQAS